MRVMETLKRLLNFLATKKNRAREQIKAYLPATALPPPPFLSSSCSLYSTFRAGDGFFASGPGGRRCQLFADWFCSVAV